jgi:hypothetical protein
MDMHAIFDLTWINLVALYKHVREGDYSRRSIMWPSSVHHVE